VYSRGEPQAAKVPLSSEHSKLEPASFEEKLKLALVLDVSGAGPEVIVVSGAVVSDGPGGSTVHAKIAGSESTFPAWSVARTRKVCAPSARSEYVRGLEQESHGPVSSWHSKVEPASLENSNSAERSLLGSVGPESIVVCGATVSTVHV
jgi:hypothetical protein